MSHILEYEFGFLCRLDSIQDWNEDISNFAKYSPYLSALDFCYSRVKISSLRNWIFFLLKLFCHFLFFSKKCFKDYKVLIFGKSQFDQEKTWKFIKWRDASKCWLNEVPTTVKWFFYYENIWNGKKYQKKVWKAKLHLEAHPQCLSLRFCQT